MCKDIEVYRYKIAGIVFDAEIKYDYAKSVCKPYLYTGEEEPSFITKITEEDISAERKYDFQDNYSDSYLESLALFRKLCEWGLSNANAVIFHSSAILVDGNAYLFTAPSGTGKSTHARLWRELLGDKAVMINDDKPIIRLTDDGFYVYGTPWTGKHKLGFNGKAKIKAICSISQAKENSIKKASAKEMLPVIMNQTLRPTDVNAMDKLLNLVDKMLKEIALYKLECNISLDAAKLSYSTMCEGGNNEN